MKGSGLYNSDWVKRVRTSNGLISDIAQNIRGCWSNTSVSVEECSELVELDQYGDPNSLGMYTYSFSEAFDKPMSSAMANPLPRLNERWSGNHVTIVHSWPKVRHVVRKRGRRGMNIAGTSR